MRYPLLILSLFFILFLVYPPPVHGKMIDTKIDKQGGPIDIEADELIYERETQLYLAHGRVEVTQGDLSLKADHVQLNRATREAMAWGNVLLREGENILECERLEINLGTQLGKVYKAKLFLKEQNFHITGQEAEKLGENRYRIREGTFTTCDAKRPPWKFSVKELEITLEGHGIAKEPVLYLEDIPVLYLPIGIFPVQKERQTGFLLPQVGYSSEYGPEVKNSFYWAMTKDMDATFDFDWLGERGLKGGLEYRYAFTPETKGEAKAYFIDDSVFNKNRFALFAQHQQKFPDDYYLKGNINHVSDNQYLRDFDEDLPKEAKIDSRSWRQLRSTLFGGKNWDRFSLLAEGAFFNDLTQESNDETLQKLPKINFYAHPQSFFNDPPLFFDVTSTYVNFWREVGVASHRGDIFPNLSFPMRLFNVVKLNSHIGVRETLYRFYKDPSGKFQGWESRETFEAGAQASTELYRVYDGTTFSKVSSLYHVARWMHTLEPTVGYRYSPRVNQRNLFTFDELDRIPYDNEIIYGVTQRLLGKPEREGPRSGPREYGKLRISQRVSLGDPFELDSKGKGRSFSNIQAEFWWNFSPTVTARWDAELNPYRATVDAFNFLVKARDQRNDVVQVQYRNTRGEIQEINVDGRIRTIGPLYLFGSVRYNLLGNWKVENIYGAEYQSQCWSLGLAVEDKGRSPDGTQKKELKVQVYFSLLNFSSVGHKSFLMDL